MLPSACASSVTRAFSRAAMAGGAIFRPLFFGGARKPDHPSGMRKEWREFAFRQWSIEQTELYRNVIKSARPETAVEVPQAGDDHPRDRDLDVRSGLIEHEEIVARPPGDLDAGIDLIARVVERHIIDAELRHNRRVACRDQERIILQAQRGDPVEARLVAASTAHQADRQELAQLGQRAQQGYAAVEMRAGTKLDILLAIFHPVHDRDI